MRSRQIRLQQEILAICHRNGSYTPNKKKPLKELAILRRAVKAGLMRENNGTYTLTMGGVNKVKEFLGD